jgi:hypothetical protein
MKIEALTVYDNWFVCQSEVIISLQSAQCDSGVVLLRLLLVPGTAFLVGGARTSKQELHPHIAQLNNTLLTVGYVS